MILTQSERVQLLRRRANLTQGELGARAFNTSPESGRTKIKNIEIGKQKPTSEDLQNMAQVLGVSPGELMPDQYSAQKTGIPEGRGIMIEPQTLAYFPELESYLYMLNKATLLDDVELIRYLAARIADVFAHSSFEAAENKT
jgi:transcriptional regulator with XRE-family HTH domain